MNIIEPIRCGEVLHANRRRGVAIAWRALPHLYITDTRQRHTERQNSDHVPVPIDSSRLKLFW